MKPVFIESVGLAAPGLPAWRQSCATLAGQLSYLSTPLPPHTPSTLPLNERRRASPAIRLAFQAAEDAIQATTLAAANLATIFASSDADITIIHRICLALAATPRLVSPTDFHNSVHNAAAGYWSIAAGARAASTTISAHDGSFGAGLLEACSQVLADECDVLLVAFDIPAPEPLLAKRFVACPAAAALLLTRRPTLHSLAAVTCAITGEGEAKLDDPALEQLRLGNPATRALPLLRLLALRKSGHVVLPLGPTSNLDVELRAP